MSNNQTIVLGDKYAFISVAQRQGIKTLSRVLMDWTKDLYAMSELFEKTLPERSQDMITIADTIMALEGIAREI